MKTILMPPLLLVGTIPEMRVLVYDGPAEAESLLIKEGTDIFFVCYEEEFDSYRELVRDVTGKFLITFSSAFTLLGDNVCCVNGEKLSGYTLLCLSKMMAENRRLQQEIVENYNIGITLSAETDKEVLWNKILSFARTATGAEGASLYLYDKASSSIHFISSQHEKHDTSSIKQRSISCDPCSFVGYVCSTGNVLNIEDAYALPDNTPYTFNKAFDQSLGDKTRSIITVPLRTPKNRVLGAIQLLNKKTAQGDYICFSKYDEMLVQSLGSLAAVVLENKGLYEDISRLFTSLVITSVKAIEQRDPATRGHSLRVAALVRMMMEEVDKDTIHFPDIHFTSHDYQAAEIAALLHDFGKVAIREPVLTKQTKLYPHEYEQMRGRVKYFRLIMEKTGFSAEEIAVADSLLMVLESVNKPGHVSEDTKELFEKACLIIVDHDGEKEPLMSQDEKEKLSIERGTLTEAERQSIEQHVVKSYEIVKTMPWPDQLSKVPDYVYSHHEKLNGSGYPAHLKGDEISLISRILTIADVYDALTASDRMYKKIVSQEKAFKILEEEAERKELDHNLVRLLRRNMSKIEEKSETWVSEYDSLEFILGQPDK